MLNAWDSWANDSFVNRLRIEARNAGRKFQLWIWGHWVWGSGNVVLSPAGTCDYGSHPQKVLLRKGLVYCRSDCESASSTLAFKLSPLRVACRVVTRSWFWLCPWDDECDVRLRCASRGSNDKRGVRAFCWAFSPQAKTWQMGIVNDRHRCLAFSKLQNNRWHQWPRDWFRFMHHYRSDGLLVTKAEAIKLSQVTNSTLPIGQLDKFPLRW